MNPQVPLTIIKAWSDRKLIPLSDPTPGKNRPRLYSLADVIRIKGAYFSYLLNGTTVAHAMQIGEVCLQRFVDKFEFRADENISYDREELLWYRWEWSKEGARLSYNWVNMATPLNKLPEIRGYNLLDADDILNHILTAYHEVDFEINKLALEGRLKPWPDHLV